MLIPFLIGTAISLLALYYLRQTDPKRARAFALQPPSSARRGKIAFWVSILPGLILLFGGYVGSFFCWFGALSVAGWIIALRRPRQEPVR
ncbi:MAG: hypothetical protein AAGA36_14875 [Pseudomonadota bacterium]